MAEHEGYVKIDRNLLRWKWVTSPSTGWLFIILLLKANYKKMTFEGIDVEIGQVVTSYPSLVKSTGLTIQQVRSAVKRLKSTGEITIKLYPRYQVITIVNYKQYQDVTGKSTVRITGKQQASNRQATSREIKDKQVSKKAYNSRSAPDSPPGTIPDLYKDQFATYDEYLAWRNQ